MGDSDGVLASTFVAILKNAATHGNYPCISASLSPKQNKLMCMKWFFRQRGLHIAHLHTQILVSTPMSSVFLLPGFTLLESRESYSGFTCLMKRKHGGWLCVRTRARASCLKPYISFNPLGFIGRTPTTTIQLFQILVGSSWKTFGFMVHIPGRILSRLWAGVQLQRNINLCFLYLFWILAPSQNSNLNWPSGYKQGLIIRLEY